MKNMLLVASVLFASSAFTVNASVNQAQPSANDSSTYQSREYIKRQKMAQWFDATLLKSGVVDANYKIIDEDMVSAYFDNVNQETSSDGSVSKAPLIKTLTFAPRGLTISNILQSNSAEASQAELIKYYQSSESEGIMLAETCPFIYHSNYALANGYRSTYQLINKYGKVVFEKSIDKAYCDKKSQ